MLKEILQCQQPLCGHFSHPEYLFSCHLLLRSILQFCNGSEIGFASSSAVTNSVMGSCVAGTSGWLYLCSLALAALPYRFSVLGWNGCFEVTIEELLVGYMGV